jgi:CTP-dependent riboflavin kinase
MEKKRVVTGKVASGAQRAAYFINLPWVQEQCVEKLGFRPYPGTLNIKVSEEGLLSVMELRKSKGIILSSPSAEFCSAKALPALVELIGCAIIIPPENVSIHAENTLEIMAPVKLKDALGIRDGDLLTIVVS